MRHAEPEPSRLDAGRTRAIWFAVVGLIALALLARGVRSFWFAYPPGMDAGYYPMQTRWLLERGRLMYDELPLMFWLNAFVAQVALWSGATMDGAVLLAAKVVDTLTQPWTAIPIAALARGVLTGLPAAGTTRAGGPRWGLWLLVIGAAALAVLSPPIQRMVGDFEKNSLGLVWVALASWAMWRVMGAIERSSEIARVGHETSRSGSAGQGRLWPRWLWPVVVLAVSLALGAITHIGAFGLAVMIVVAAGGVFALGRWRGRVLIAAAAIVTVCAGLLWGVVYVAAPQKAVGLLQGPVKMLRGGDAPTTRGVFESPRASVPRGASDVDDRRAGSVAQAARGEGRRLPGAPGTESILPRTLLWAMVVAGGVFAWRSVARERAADRAIVAGLVIAAGLITLPLLQGTYVMRFMLMTPVVLAVPLAVLMGAWMRSERPWTRGAGVVGAGLVLIVSVLGGVASVATSLGGRGGPGGQVVSDEAGAELLRWRELLPQDGKSIVLARHGLQWWAGYFLRSPVREIGATREQLLAYDRVFVLQERASSASLGRLEGGPIGAAGRDAGGGGGGGAMGPGRRVALPENAELVAEGRFYTLHEVRVPR